MAGFWRPRRCSRREVRVGSILHNKAADRWVPSLADGFEPGVQRVVGRSEIDDQHLVFVVVDPAVELRTQLRDLAGVEIGEEHAALGMVAHALEAHEDAFAALVVGHVVGDQMVAAGAQRVTTFRWWGTSPRNQRDRRRA